jgi:hypothetical protein
LSSAILYLAIVAIWACVLVPRWLHRSHDTASEEELSAGPEDAADRLEADGPEGPADADEPPGHVEEYATLREQVVEAEAHSASEGHVASARFTSVSYSVTEVSVSAADPGEHEGLTAQESAPDAGAASAAGSSRRRPPSQPHPRDPAAGRARVLRARRRMLTILLTLAVAVAAATLVGLAGWWVVTLPVGLLGLYLLVLRVAARSDAENDRRRTEAHARAALAARERAALAARERARQAREALAQPTAEIIDISALATQGRDQPYDQYADAEVRAVGD